MMLRTKPLALPVTNETLDMKSAVPPFLEAT